jgi:hypothetical protein
VMMIHTRVGGGDRLGTIEKDIVKQIAYPKRHSALVSWLQHSSSTRVINALTMLFEVCCEIYDERIAAGMSEEEAHPVLLFDDVQDLIQNERLAANGGEEVFLHLSKLLATHVIDKQKVRAAVAGSSTELKHSSLNKGAKEKWWRYYELPDPDPQTVTAALQKKGFTADDAKQLIETCGTHLRLLEEPFAVGSALYVRKYLKEEQELACADVNWLLKALPSEADRRAVAAVLDRLAAASPSAAVPRDDLPASALESSHFSDVLYVTKEDHLRF